MANAATLYTPAVLALATDLAKFPLADDLLLRGEARSATCGSAITLGLGLNPDGSIARLGVKAHACAIGQAAVAIFAKGACGKDHAAISRAEAAVADWLSGHGTLPDWPQLGLIAAAQAYPARHGAILLPWRAALAALPSS